MKFTFYDEDTKTLSTVTLDGRCQGRYRFQGEHRIATGCKRLWAGDVPDSVRRHGEAVGLKINAALRWTDGNPSHPVTGDHYGNIAK